MNKDITVALLIGVPLLYRLLLLQGLPLVAVLLDERLDDNMAHAFAKPLYDSPAWKSCRQAYIANRIKIDGGLCEECHMRIGRIVHHKIMINEENVGDSNITLNHDNLEYVCKYCHDRMDDHFVKQKASAIRYKFDDSGQPYI